jgi:hypothetical protein
MPSSNPPKKLKPKRVAELERIAELEKQIANQNKTIGVLLLLHQ